MSLLPFRPEDFDEACETCLAPAGQLCRPWCDTGYTAADYRAQTEPQAHPAEGEPPDGAHLR